MPWDEDGTDYDEPRPSGDSHEDEFDEEYGEQQPKGDPDQARADELAAAYGADIEFWENQGADNRQQDPPAEPESAPFMRERGEFDDFTFSWATDNVAGALHDANRVAMSSRFGLDRDDFDWADGGGQVAPPTPETPAGEPPVDFDVAVPLSEARDETRVSLSFPQRSPDRSESRDVPPSAADDQSEEPVIETGGAGSQSVDPAHPFGAGFGDGGAALSYPISEAEPESVDADSTSADSLTSESYSPAASSFDPATEFGSDVSHRMDSTEYLG